MKIDVKKILAAAAALSLAVPLTGCAATITESLETAKPWRMPDSEVPAYERLEYSVSYYNCEVGADENTRALIASGTLVYTLDEQPQSGGSSMTFLDTDFTLTYNVSEFTPESDRGFTDRITSHTEFQTSSLNTSRSSKKVMLADRPEVKNLSYSIETDYFDAHKATVDTADGQWTTSIPNSTYHDNEMMIYLARTTGISPSANKYFYMVNMFDCYLSGEFENRAMRVTTADEVVPVDVGDWVSGFGVEQTEDENGVTSYPVLCYNAAIMINPQNNYGPPHYVYYSQDPFTKNGISHSLIPVRIRYSQYNTERQTRETEMLLTSCSFERP